MMTNEKIRDYNMCIRIHIGVRDNDVLQVIGNFDEWSSDVVGMNETINYDFSVRIFYWRSIC